MNEFKGSSKYVVSEDLLRIVNISIALQKPLLIKRARHRQDHAGRGHF